MSIISSFFIYEHFQGIIASIQGGDGVSSAVFGAVSSIASSAWGGMGIFGATAGRLANSGTGMVLFGTVAGDAAASLTGGNFWQGAGIGLVVSLLNHVMHEIDFRTSLREKIMGGGLDPDAKPEMSSEYITGTLNKKVEGLEEAYINGGKPSFYFSDYKSENVAEHNLSSSNRITVYKPNAKTVYRLVSSLFHEYRHAWQVMSSFYSIAQDKYGPLGPEGTYSKLRSLIEWDAYNFQINVGGEVDGFIIGQRDLMKKYFENR